MIKLNTKRILIPHDFSVTSTKAIKHAAIMAKYNQGEVFLLYVKKNPSILNILPSKSELREIAKDSENYKRLMEDSAEEIRNKYGVPVKVLVGVGGKIHEILKIAEKKNVGLIVMGTQGSESVSNLFSGSNSHKVVSKSQIPVLTVRTVSKKDGYATILLPIDLSEHTRQKVNVAIQLAKIYSSKIHLIGLFGSNEADHKFKLQSILKQVEKRIKLDDVEVSQETHLTKDAVKTTLLSAKQINADIIITMTDQKAGSGNLLSPTYDHQLVDESGIPVLSIPPEVHDENIEPASIGGLW